MSITRHLKNLDSPIGQFLRTRFATTSALSREANAQLRRAQSILPMSRQSYPYGAVGMAMDYRLRYYFGATAVEEFIAYKGAACLFDLAPEYHGELLERFFDALTQDVARLQPTRRQLDFDAETLLARYCFVLALFEEAFRSHLVSDLLVLPTIRHSVDELLAVADDAWIDEMCRMSRLFYARFQHLLTKPFILNPTFAGSPDVGGADADLIVDGCLIEVKTSVNTYLDTHWLRQLAGYVLLDYEDALSIRSVGIYMARQGVLLTWPLDTYLALLTGDDGVDLAVLRSQFRDECRKYREQLRAEALLRAARRRQAEEESRKGMCLGCGQRLTYTEQRAVERKTQRGRMELVDIITLHCNCETYGVEQSHEYRHPYSSRTDLDKLAKRRWESIVYSHNSAIATIDELWPEWREK